jgi:preprotein translocase subunit YajC
MSTVNIGVLVIVGLAALALLIFMIVKNQRDKKKYFPPESTDPVEEEKTDSLRKGDKI